MRSRTLPEALVRAAVQPLADGTDADLLGRFVQERDAAAFEALVRRHGPMVLGVCRRALGDTPDADDAFQAVWLVLMRKARSVSPRGKVGNWLYGVAARCATHTRSKNAKRHAAQRALPDVPDPRPADHDAGELAASAVDAELTRLPDRYRAAVVLCELEGRSLKDAAEHLGVPLGTVASRLARGRALLASRLTARGFAAAAVAGWFATATVPVSARLADLTVSLLKVGPQDVASAASELSRGVLSIMLANKLKAAGQALVAVALAAGAVVWAATAGAQPVQPPPTPPPVGDGRFNEFAGRLDPKRGPVVIHPAEGGVDPRWADLAREEPYASQAVLKLAAEPKAAVPLFQQKIKPLKADAAQTKKLIADLASETREVWGPAFETLSYHDPRLALDPDAAFAEAKTPLARQRLAAILVDSPDPAKFAPTAGGQRIELTGGGSRTPQRVYTLTVTGGSGRGEALAVTQTFSIPASVSEIRRGSWLRAARAVSILEHLRTPESYELMKEMATGHPDALPTVAAKNAYVLLTAPTP